MSNTALCVSSSHSLAKVGQAGKIHAPLMALASQSLHVLH